jgi:CBS domain containing-hemolysin-like protein
MIWLTVIAGLVMLGLGAWASAVHLALQEPSRSELEDLLRARGRQGVESTTAWIFTRRRQLATEVALIRTALRVGVTMSAVVLIVEAEPDVVEIAIATISSVLLIWFATSVVAGAIAVYLGASLVVRGVGLLRVVDLVLGPVATVATLVDEAIRRLSGANLREHEVEDRLRRSIEDTTLGGGLDEAAAEMLENVVEFTSTEVGTVMTPRTDIEGLPMTQDLGEVRDFIAEAGHSRIPVYGENLDDILGILYVKDLVPWLGAEPADFRLDRLLRQPIRVPETKPVKDLLRDFQRSEVHMAIVVDEYGGTSGLVTIEDVLEEIVGEIQDEHDTAEEQPPSADEVSPGRWELDARYQIYDLNELLEIDLPEDDDFDTVAGYILERMGRVPEAGESLEADGLRFEVLAATPTRIDRVSVERLDHAEGGVDVAAGEVG